MKTFIIHIKGNKKSEEYANLCLESCNGKNLDAELFEGVTTKTLKEYDTFFKKSHIIPSRANNFYNENKNLYAIKKCVFLNGYRLWKKCIELNEPIVVLEHDSYCIREWDNKEFDELLILNGESCFKQDVFKHLERRNKFPKFEKGTHIYKLKVLNYHFNNNFLGATMIPGAAAYAINPNGARKLVEIADNLGWEQNDHFLNTKNIKMEIVIPEYFTFKMPNLNTSHGKNI